MRPILKNVGWILLATFAVLAYYIFCLWWDGKLVWGI